MKDRIIEMLEEGDLDLDGMVSELFLGEDNYNNADKTTGQMCYTEEEIKEMVLKVLEDLKESGEWCFSCGKLLIDDDFQWEQNLCTNDPYPIYETIATGYVCTCGHEERF
jgi:hypothetical protein